MATPVEELSFAELVLRMNQLMDSMEAAVKRILVGELNGPGPFTLNPDTQSGVELTVANGTLSSMIVVNLPATSPAGTVHLLRQGGPASVKLVPADGATLKHTLNHNGIGGIEASVRVTVRKNPGGNAAYWVLDGYTAAL